MTSFGHEAVMIFFVLSGYLVGGSVLKQKEKFEWVRYAITRLTRLWVVLMPALMLTLVIDQAIQSFYPEVFSGTYSALWASGPSEANFSREPLVFIGNVLFQQTVFVPVFGTNSPVWSLSNEFYYYCLFPMMMLLFGYVGKRKTIFEKMALGVSGLAILVFLPAGFAEGFLVFCMGALVAWLKGQGTRDKGQGRYQMMIGFAVLLFTLYLSKSNISLRYVSKDILIGLSFSVLLISLMRSQLPFAPLRRAAAFMADISYSLYLTHFPIVLLIAATFYGTNQVKPDVIGMSQFVAWLGVVLLMALTFWFLFERHTDSVRHKVMAFVARRTSPHGKSE